MTVYTDPNTFVQESRNKFLLRINSKECKVLLQALKSFDDIDAKNKPSTNSLKKAINQIDSALLNEPASTSIEMNGYEAQDKCEPCQD